jgi:hypothetical protein
VLMYSISPVCTAFLFYSNKCKCAPANQQVLGVHEEPDSILSAFSAFLVSPGASVPIEPVPARSSNFC